MTNQWDDEADVIVVGYGGAGASAAIAAHDAGVSVLIIEKDQGGGNTKLATRTFISPENSAAARQHILALSAGALDEPTLESSLRWMSRNNDFIRELGGEVEICPPGATFPLLPGAESMIRYESKRAPMSAAGSRCGICSRATSTRAKSESIGKPRQKSCSAPATRSPASSAIKAAHECESAPGARSS